MTLTGKIIGVSGIDAQREGIASAIRYDVAVHNEDGGFDARGLTYRASVTDRMMVAAPIGSDCILARYGDVIALVFVQDLPAVGCPQ